MSEPKRSISKKKESQLYNVVANRIMDARLEVSMILKGNSKSQEVEEILYKLHRDAPQKAIDLFIVKPPKK